MTDSLYLHSRLYDAVTELAAGTDNPDVIAVRLATAQITGRPRSAVSCPVARYLSGIVDHKVFVSHGRADIHDPLVSVHLPFVIQDFIAAFDALGPHAYRDLIEKDRLL